MQRLGTPLHPAHVHIHDREAAEPQKGDRVGVSDRRGFAQKAAWLDVGSSCTGSGAFFYYGRPPLVVQGMVNTQQMMFGDGVSAYTLSAPVWGQARSPIRSSSRSGRGWIEWLTCYEFFSKFLIRRR